MTIEQVLQIGATVVASLGGGALIVAAFSDRLAGIWAKRMLQNERAKHAEALEELKAEILAIKQKELNRHFDKAAIYKDVVHIVAEILRELEAVASNRQAAVSPEVEKAFALHRNKAYGYISLVSSQEVMDRYNDMIDFFIPLLYEGKSATWVEMRELADAMLNAMRKDLGINDSGVYYRGGR
jgi:hypothetical protein